MNDRLHIPSEKGFILVMALVILVLMTVMGMVAMRTATTDIMVAINDRVFKQDFYLADAALNKEASLLVDYPVHLTIAEQRKHAPYTMVSGFDADTFHTKDGDITLQQGSKHMIGGNKYQYAVKFIRREQALVKGEGARSVDLVYHEIATKGPDGVGLVCQIYRRIANK